MIIDGIASVQGVFDSAAEYIESLHGLDISSYNNGQAIVNFEHLPDAAGPEGVIGKVLMGKRIYTADDCDDDRQFFFFKQAGGRPYLYVKVRIFDEAGHDQARAIAAIIRDGLMNKEPIMISYSIEGVNLVKEGPAIKEAVLKKLALTYKACLKCVQTGVISDSNSPVEYSQDDSKDSDPLKFLTVKSEMDIHGNVKVGPAIEFQFNPIEKADKNDELMLNALKLLLKVKVLKKALTAGGMNAAPSTLTGGAALQKEDKTLKKDLLPGGKADSSKPDDFDPESLKEGAAHEKEHTNNEDIAREIAMDHLKEDPKYYTKIKLIEKNQYHKSQALAMLRDFGSTKAKFNKAEFKEFVKTKMSDVSEDFLNHFVDLMDNYSIAIKKHAEPSFKLENLLVDLKSSIEDL